MNVGSICSHRVVCVSTSATLAEVAVLMNEEHVGAVIVTAGGADPHAVGIITDRDIVRAQLDQVADLSRLSAGETMTGKPLVFEESESIEGAIAHLRARGVRRAPVVTADGKPIGLVSTDDLLAHLAGTLSGMAGIVARQLSKESTERR